MTTLRFSRPARLLVTTAAVLALTIGMAEARPGGGSSSGSRGSKTFSAPPPTSTAPSAAAPMERSITQPSAPRPGMNAPAGAPVQPAAAAPSFGRSLLGGIAGGFLGAGLFGMLSGQGFMGGMGGFASLLGLLVQAGLIVGLIFLVMRMFRNRQQSTMAQPAYASQSAAPGTGPAGFGAVPGFGGGGRAVAPEQPVDIGPSDYEAFERVLVDVQDAYSNEDLARLRGLATPEMVAYFGEDLAANSAKGLVDRVSNVRLLQGDLAEAWREDGTEYATVAMRISMINAMMERATDRVVEGSLTAPQEGVEIWTFRRPVGGKWMLSAIQQTA